MSRKNKKTRYEESLDKFVSERSTGKQIFPKKQISDFIAEHREELRGFVRGAVPNARYFDDDELEMWVMNDEYLYNWALREGVDI